MKKLLLIALLSCALQAQIKFDYEPELYSIIRAPGSASITDVIKVHNHAIRWIRQTIEDNASGKHVLTKEERAYLESIAFLLADICNEIGYMPRC